jgi:hypothetical protein
MRILVGAFCSVIAAVAQSTVLYQTGFERNEGYDPQFTLAQQQGWIGEGTGGNGLLADVFPEMGQQAYIGFHPPTDTNDYTSVWKPLNISPLPEGQKIVRFSVTLQIVQSTAGGDDDFRWSVYSAASTRLLSLDFETRSGEISFIPQDGQFYSTGYTFDFAGTYDLILWLNYERNLWTALLNDRVIVNSEPIAQMASDLTLGDVDAVWIIRNPAGVGNNYMLFDDYRISAEAVTSIPGVLEPIGVNGAGHFTFNVHAEKGRSYSVDVTTNFSEWFSLGNFPNTTGTFLFEDTTSKGESKSFYRLRQLE